MGRAQNPIRATVLVLLAFITVFAAFPLPHAQGQEIDIGPVEELSPEQQLAERYAPIAYLKRQRYSCDPSGEAYLPLPINAVMDDPSVILRLDTGGASSALDRIVQTGPAMEDLAWLGPGYYLDFPGTPLRPGCWYEHWSRSMAQEYEPTVYARIGTEEGVEGLALQYWLFWVFNDFNNRHEGDWEMIQVNFTASTVEGALADDPVSVTYAQHSGGEEAAWDGNKIHREGDHPIIYSAAGSHASYFDDRTYLGWGPGGTGFGCDVTTRPGRRVPLNVILIPDNPQIDSQFGWLFFRGRFGEKQTWEYDGPVGPHRGRKWREPVSWAENVRDRSLYVPESFSLGPTPGGVFCEITGWAAQGLMFFTMHPWRMAMVLVSLFGGSVYLAVSRRWALIRSSWLYMRHWGSFSSLGLAFIPLGLAAVIVQHLLSIVPPGKWIVELLGRSDEGRLAASLLLGGAQGIVDAVVIGPAVIMVIQMMRKGEPTDAETALRDAWSRRRVLFRSWIRVQGLILLRAVTIIGIPFALREMVRWAFYQQAVMIDDAATAQGAAGTSAAAVHRGWWRSAGEVLMFTIVGLLPGPLIGILLMVTLSSSIEFVYALSSILYAIAVPYKWIGLTLLYLKRTGRPLPVDIPNVPGAFVREIRERLPFGREPVHLGTVPGVTRRLD